MGRPAFRWLPSPHPLIELHHPLAKLVSPHRHRFVTEMRLRLRRVPAVSNSTSCLCRPAYRSATGLPTVAAQIGDQLRSQGETTAHPLSGKRGKLWSPGPASRSKVAVAREARFIGLAGRSAWSSWLLGWPSRSL